MPPRFFVCENTVASPNQRWRRRSRLYARDGDGPFKSDYNSDDDTSSSNRSGTSNRNSGGDSKNPSTPTNTGSNRSGSSPNGPVSFKTGIARSAQRTDSITVNAIVLGVTSTLTLTTPSAQPPSSAVTATITTITTTAIINPITAATISSTSSTSNLSFHTTLPLTPPAAQASSASPVPANTERTTLNLGAIFAIVLGISTLLSLVICFLLYRAKIRRARTAKLELLDHLSRPTISSFEPAEYAGTSLSHFPSKHRSLKSCVTLPSFFIFGSPFLPNTDIGATVPSPAVPSAALLPSRSSNRWTQSTFDQRLSPLSFDFLLDDSKSEYGLGYDPDVDGLPELGYLGSAMTHSVEHAKRSSFGTNTCSAYHTHTKSILKPGGLNAPLPPLPVSSKSIKWVKDLLNTGQ